MMIRTLRGRLTAWYLAILASSLAVFAGLLYVTLARSLYEHHDHELEQDADRLVRGIGSSPLRPAELSHVLDRAGELPQLLILRRASGEMLYQSPALAVAEPDIGRHEALVHAAAAGSAGAQFFTVTLEHLGPVRFICVPIGASRSSYLQVGRALGDVDATLHTVATASFVLVPLVLLLSSFGGLFIAGRALAPIQAIVSTVRNIQATDLSRRTEVHPKDQELAALVTTLNQLLDRLEDAFAALREFAADVSHQLQTPLTLIEGSLEDAPALGEISPACRGLLADIAEEVSHMSAVIADLQSLSLAASRPPSGLLGRIDLSALCHEVSEVLTAFGESKDVRVTAEICDGIHLHGDAVRFRQMLLNLGENAIKYTAAGGHVEVNLREEPGFAIVQVSDTGIGIPADEVPRIFDRFYRVRPLRAGDGGTGLGLAIVKRIVDVHGGSISVDSKPGAGSTFTVRLPRINDL